MNDLTQKRCVPCEGGMQALTAPQAAARHSTTGNNLAAIEFEAWRRVDSRTLKSP